MACVDVLSDDDDVAPTTALTTSHSNAEVSQQPAAPVDNVDILSDDADNKSATADMKPALPEAPPEQSSHATQSQVPPSETVATVPKERLVEEGGTSKPKAFKAKQKAKAKPKAKGKSKADTNDGGDDTCGASATNVEAQAKEASTPAVETATAAVPALAQDKEVSTPAVEAATTAVPALEVGKNGLRSVVVASLDLVDSDEEDAKSMVAKEQNSAPPVVANANATPPTSDQKLCPPIQAKEPNLPPPVVDTSSEKVTPQVEDDSEDEMIAPTGTLNLQSIESVPAVTGSKPMPITASTMDAKDSEDEEMLVVPGAQSASPGTPGSPKKRSQTSEAPQPPAKKAKEGQSESKDLKDKKLSKEEMESKVLQYMQQQNRPYNSQNVFDNLHGAVPKGQVQLILDSLACSGQILVKEFGKSKVYLISQSSITGGAEGAENETASLQAEVDIAMKKVQETKAAVEEIKKELASLRNHRSIVEEIETLQREAPGLDSRLAELRAAAEESAKETEASCDVGEQDIDKIEASCRDVHAEWRRRKRLCMEIVHRFCEMSGMKVAKIIEKYGVETDEECNQPFPECMK